MPMNSIKDLRKEREWNSRSHVNTYLIEDLLAFIQEKERCQKS